MKKSLLLASLLALALTACGQKEEAAADTDTDAPVIEESTTVIEAPVEAPAEAAAESAAADANQAADNAEAAADDAEKAADAAAEEAK